MFCELVWLVGTMQITPVEYGYCDGTGIIMLLPKSQWWSSLEKYKQM